MSSITLTIELPDDMEKRLQAAAATQGQDVQNYAVAAIVRAIDRDLAIGETDGDWDDEAWWQSLPEEEREASLAALRSSNERAVAGHARPFAEYAAEARKRRATPE